MFPARSLTATSTAGGNFVDTADAYTGGHSEELVGKFIADRKLRDRIVLATKFTFNTEPGNPNAGGNGRKNVYRALRLAPQAENGLHRSVLAACVGQGDPGRRGHCDPERFGARR